MFARISGYFGVRLIASALQAVAIILLARMLGPLHFGLFVSVAAIGNVIGVLVSFGAQSQALRLLAAEFPAQLGGALLALRLTTSSVLGVAIAATIAAVSDLGAEFAIATSLYVVAESVSTLVQSILVGLQKRTIANWLALARPLWIGAGLLVAFLLDVSILLGFAIGAFSSSVLSTALVLRYLAKPTALCPVVRSSVPYWASTSLASLQQLDVPIVGASASAALAGSYAGAVRVVNPLNLATTSLLAIVTPELSAEEELAQRRRTFRRALAIGCWLMGAFFGGSIIAGYAGPLLLGDQYSESGPLFVGLSVGLGLNAVSQVYASWFYAQNEAARLSIIRLFTIPSTLILVFLGSCSGNVWLLAGGIAGGRLLEVIVLAWQVRRSAF